MSRLNVPSREQSPGRFQTSAAGGRETARRRSEHAELASVKAAGYSEAQVIEIVA
jgi:hypothetical protein